VFTGFWLGGPKGRDYWKNLGICGRIILNCLNGNRDRWSELDSAGSEQGPVADFCEYDNEPSVSIKKAGYSLTS